MRGQVAVKVGDKSFDATVNMNALRLYCEAEQITLAEFEKIAAEQPLDFVPKILFHGVRSNAHFNGKPEPEINYNQFAAHICQDAAEFQRLTEVVGNALNSNDETEGN